MARSNSGSENKPARTPARRRADKAVQGTSASSSPGNGRIKDPDGMSLKDADYNPSPAEVQRRAYELYVRRGGGHGRDLEDWLEAERQLRRQEGREPPRG